MCWGQVTCYLRYPVTNNFQSVSFWADLIYLLLLLLYYYYIYLFFALFCWSFLEPVCSPLVSFIDLFLSLCYHYYYCHLYSFLSAFLSFLLFVILLEITGAFLFSIGQFFWQILLLLLLFLLCYYYVLEINVTEPFNLFRHCRVRSRLVSSFVLSLLFTMLLLCS